MKIYIINLEKDINKRKKIKNRLDNINIKYEIINAIDGINTDLYVQKGIYKGWVDSYHNRYITKGEIGCALSHYYIWERIINENIEKAIILEDDVEVLDKDFIEKVNNVKYKYDLLYLSRKKITGKSETSITKDIAFASPSYWTCSYAISLPGAKKMKNDIFLENIIPVDEYLPYLYSSVYNKYLDNVFGEIPKISALTFKNNLLNPEDEAFQVSSTYFSPPSDIVREDVLLITVATEMNEPLKRYILSCKQFGFNPKVLGLGTKWSGGDMKNGPGGGQKIILLQEYIKTLNSSDNKIIVFTDSYDVICNNNINKLVERYRSDFKNNIIFASEYSCWPDKCLEHLYPETKCKNRYLNSGLFIGYLNDIRKLVEKEIKAHEDDQLYYTREFLKNKDNIKLDYENKLFLCLNCDDKEYRIDKSRSLLIINSNNNIPSFIHGNGIIQNKIKLNNIGNYTCNYYNKTYGYNNINKIENHKPNITIIFEETINPCKEVIEGLINIDYPIEKISLVYLYNKQPENKIINKFYKYKLIKRLGTDTLLQSIININSDKVFYITSNCEITNKDILNKLLYENKSFIGPMLRDMNSYYSNFWGDLDNNNYYKRSANYIDIIENNEKNCWNVPYLNYCFLIDSDLFTVENFSENLHLGSGNDMALCYNMRIKNIFIYVINTEIFGFFTNEKGVKQINSDDIELNDYSNNKKLWEAKYLHPYFNHDVMEEIGNNINKSQIFTKVFCDEIIKTISENGNWSKGGNSYFDNRIGGTENYPTQDIHLKDVGLEEMWKWILDTYISPLVYKKYKYKYKNINLSFVVKYSMDAQKELNAHHDASTYTVNLCLNDEFEGGGCYFITNNIKCINKDIGSIVLHPGRLTHYHSGLPITDGNRFILVSFIN